MLEILVIVNYVVVGIQANFRTPVGAVSLGFVDVFKSKDGDDTKPVIFSLGGAF